MLKNRNNPECQTLDVKAVNVDLMFSSEDLAVFIQDLQGKIENLNPQLMHLLELSKDSLLDAQGFLDFCLPEEVERASLCFQAASKGIPQHLDSVGLQTIAGKQLYVELTYIPIFQDGSVTGLYGILKDITEKMAAETALKESSILHQQIQRMSHLGNWTWDVSNNQVTWSDELYNIYGLDKDSFKATFEGYLELLHPDDRAVTQQTIINALHSQQDVMFEERIVRPNGEMRYLQSWAAVTVDSKGKPVKMFGACLDITRRKKSESERLLLIEELTKINKDLKQFSYITSHNLRGPVTNLISMVDLIETSDIQNERTLQLIQGFSTSTHQLNETLNDLINILIVKSNTNLEIESLEFAKVFEKVQQSIHSLIVESRAEILTDFTPAPFVPFNQAYLESIFLNLLTNAVKYASPDRPLKIIIKSTVNQGKTQLKFSDNGLGMNMNKVKDRIFGLHQRFHNHPDSKGIGLYLTHSQVTALGGSITVESIENEGTTFTINFK
jgi:PAS domain S-box-containing protein